MTEASHPRGAHGPLLMVGASAGFVTMIALVKSARGWGYDAAELIGWRALLAVPLLVLVAGFEWRVNRVGLVVLRCVLGFLAMFCYFSATAGLGIAELAVITKLQPLFIAVLAPLFLGATERPSRHVWSALGLGMFGTLVLVWPVLDDAPIRLASAGFAFAAAIFSSLAHTTLRALGPTERPAAVVFWFQLAVGVAAVAASWIDPRPVVVPTLAHVPHLFGIGLAAMLGQWWMTRAYQADRAARVAAASYVAPVFGFAVDVVVFGQPPTLHAALAAVLVISAGAVLLSDRR